MLREQQAAFVAVLRGVSAGLLDDAIIPGSIAAEARMAIYRNNVLGNLAACLQIAYPAVEKLVGADCFAGLCRDFIQARPPVCANLYEYGAEFAIYLEASKSLKSLPYLADVARLEWAVNIALHAAETPPLDPGALAGVDVAETGFVRHPSVSLLILRDDARGIWEAVLLEDVSKKDALLAAIEISAAAVPVIVSRSSGTLEIMPVTAPVFDFALILLSGFPLADALEATTPDEAPAMLGMFLAQGLFAGIVPASSQTKTHETNKENHPCQT
ncbi:DNA-binding domain-containing protein [Acidocella sp.]|uniref:HvfC/BufC N-terminal domain-containing protein n=1 Tax=Acidocella sp. TaxID=50710 RepID=UPI00185A7D0C|nr:DNA-binding domain-containing protein [Acidocella sp.]NNM56827.1 DUF2063 domain-containing protein [Acidocella sp.]